jgi:hypothetical protein
MAAITAETGVHPAARQLAAYNAPRSPAKLAGFLKCFAADTVELRDLGSGAVKMTATQIATRYGTVFEHSTALRAKVSKRLLVTNPAARDRSTSFAVDFEQFVGLVAPTGGALDGSTGLAAPAAADIVVVYRVVGNTPGEQLIDLMWGGGDTEGVGRWENAALAAVQRTPVWQRIDALIRGEFGLGASDELQVQYVKWDAALALEAPAPAPQAAGKQGGGTCWLCGKSSGAVLRGCGCVKRAHASCVAAAAESARQLWLQCPGCQQEWTGDLGLELAKKRFELAGQLDDGVAGSLDEKLGAALDLTHALNESKEYDDAVKLGALQTAPLFPLLVCYFSFEMFFGLSLYWQIIIWFGLRKLKSGTVSILQAHRRWRRSGRLRSQTIQIYSTH